MNRLHRHLAWLALGVVLALAACSDAPRPSRSGDRCASTADCRDNPALVCLEGACQLVDCERTADCPDGAACQRGLCLRRQCETSQDCSQGQPCFEGACIEGGCESVADCPTGQACTGIPPTCQPPPPLCDDERDCPADTVCRLPDRSCASRCQHDTDCPDPELCDGEVCRPPCENSGQCAGQDICVSQRCITPVDCADAAPCTGLLGARSPYDCSCVACVADADCDAQRGQRCTDALTCLFCPLETDDARDCAARGMVLADGCCTDCASDTDCTDASAPFCDAGRCVEAAPHDCLTDSDCAGDTVCLDAACEPAASLADCVVQSDCPTGEACFDDGRCHAESDSCADCPSPSRCVGDRRDTRGVCRGCTDHCGSAGCPDDTVCFVDEGAAEGFCAEPTFAPECAF